MLLLLLLLPHFALASINVSMKGMIFYDDNKLNIVGTANQKGFDQQVVTDEDLALFNIDNYQLRNIIEKIHGLKPDQVLVRSDVDFGDIYKKQGWNPVQRKIEPDVDGCFFDFKEYNVVLTNTNHQNPTNKKKTIQIIEAKTANNYVMSIWTRPMVKGRNVNVKFDFDVDNNYIAETQKEFGIGDNRRFVIHEQFIQNRTIDLLPNQSVRARLEATKGTITAVIPYKVTLSGDVVAKYNSMYRNKYIHKFDINQILAANQKNPTITVYQTVLFEFHYDMKLHIININNDSILRTFAEEHGSGKESAGKRKAAAKKEFESTGGVKLRMQTIPAEFVENIHKAVVNETIDENEENDELE